MDRTPSPITAALLESLRRLEFYQQHFQTSTSSLHLCSTCTQRCNVSTQAIITSLLQWQSWGFFKPLCCVESTGEVNSGLCVCVRAELLILGLLWTTLALQLRWTNRSGTDFNYFLFIYFLLDSWCKVTALMDSAERRWRKGCSQDGVDGDEGQRWTVTGSVLSGSVLEQSVSTVSEELWCVCVCVFVFSH